jgi:hypothetical protein
MNAAIQHNAPGAADFMPGAQPQQPGLWEGLKQLSPFGEGDTSPWIRQGVQQAMSKQGFIGSGILKSLGGSSWMKALARHTIDSPNLPAKWLSRAAWGSKGALGLGLPLGFTMGYTRAPGIAQQAGAEAGMAGMQQGFQQAPWWGREAAAIDPTLIMKQMDRRMPGTAQNYQNMTGRPAPQGILSGLADKFTS